VDDLAATFDALQLAAFRTNGYPGLWRYWAREFGSLFAVPFRRVHVGRSSIPEHDVSRRPLMGFLTHDLRDAMRALIRTPGYTALVVLTLALGIGANTAIFSLLDALLFKPLPYAEPDRLVQVNERHPSGGWNTVAPANFLDWQRMARSFVALEARANRGYALLDGGMPEELRGARVSAGYFTLLGTVAAVGRTFVPADGEAGAPCAAVISHRLWTSRFGADPAVVGQPLRFSGETCMLVGVLPPDSVFDRGSLDVYTPLVFAPGAASRTSHFLTVIGRLAPGVTVEQARLEMADLAARINAANPGVLRGWSATADPLRDFIVRTDNRRLVWVLAGAVGLVLLVACVNIAGLVLSRTAARSREVAVRMALGAGRWRVFRALVVETLVLSTCGAALGFVVGQWLLAAFTAFAPAGTLPPEAMAALDGRALAFTAAVAVFTGLAAGTLPAWQGARGGVAAALRAGGRGASGSRTTSRLHSALLVAEVALAMVLVTGAALLVVSFLRLTGVDPGFDSSGVMTARIALPDTRYKTPESHAAFFAELLARLRDVPGVSHASAVTSLPLGGWLFGTTFTIDGIPPSSTPTSAHIQHVSGDYAGTLGLRVVEGRAILDADDANQPRVVMVNETFARRFLAGQPAIGRQLVLDAGSDAAAPRWEIVGVLRDVKTGGLGDPALHTPEIYVSFRQVPAPAMFVAVRAASGTPEALLPGIRARVAAIDPELPLGRVAAMDSLIGSSVRSQRFRTAVVSAFALLAGLLACLGVYAVRSQAMHARRREVGIRLALGATPRQVLKMTVAQGLRLVAAGLALGLGGALVLSRFIEPWLFDTPAADPAMLAAATAALGAAGLAASWVPARRAANTNPLATLRAE